jgi:translin
MRRDCLSVSDDGLERLRAELDLEDAAREHALSFSRELVRKSASAIRLVHQRRYDDAEAQIRSHGEDLRAFRESVVGQAKIVQAPFVSDAEKEHVEAWVTLCLATGRSLPSPDELGTPPAPYLNGLAEGVMEIRRCVVDRLRHDEIEDAEAILARMDDIYAALITFDYPDAILEGLKRRLDTVRGVIEKTRHDLMTAVRQDRLAAALRDFEQRVMPE